ncbi:lamin tail domain-containing protein [Thermoproteota archaeon]
MDPKKEYQLKKLNTLLSTSFNNVKYDVRGLNERVETLKNQLAHLSADSVYKALEEQNRVVLEQQKSINLLMSRLENLESLRKEANATAMHTMILPELKKELKAVAGAKAPVKKAKKTSAYSDIKEGEVKITKVQFKAPGNGKKNLNGEWVEITGYNADLTGYKLHDNNKKHVFKFPKGFTVYGPVKIFTGKGRDTNTRLYWNRPRPVWNDNADIATLRDKRNRVVSKVKSETAHTFDVLK